MSHANENTEPHPEDGHGEPVMSPPRDEDAELLAYLHALHRRALDRLSRAVDHIAELVDLHQDRFPEVPALRPGTLQAVLEADKAPTVSVYRWELKMAAVTALDLLQRFKTVEPGALDGETIPF